MSDLADTLRTIADADEIQISSLDAAGDPRPALPIWIVEADGDLYVRAVRGAQSLWWRHARDSGKALISVDGDLQLGVDAQDADPALQDQVDEAYRVKYGERYPTIIGSILAEEPRRCTLRLRPA